MDLPLELLVDVAAADHMAHDSARSLLRKCALFAAAATLMLATG